MIEQRENKTCLHQRRYHDVANNQTAIKLILLKRMNIGWGQDLKCIKISQVGVDRYAFTSEAVLFVIYFSI